MSKLRNQWIVYFIKAFLLVTLCDRCACQRLQLIGVGASLPVEVYEAWAPAFENYRSQFVNLNNEYFAIGQYAMTSHFQLL